MGFWRRINKMMAKGASSRQGRQPIDDKQEAGERQSISGSLQHNYNVVCALYNDCSDVVLRQFRIGESTDAFLIYIEQMCDTELLDQHVLAPLMSGRLQSIHKAEDVLRTVTVSHTKVVSTYEEAVEHISGGNVIVFVDKLPCALFVGLAKWQQRAIDEPVAESVVRGPRFGFTETLGVNTSLMRRQIKSPLLKMKSIQIGRYTRTQTIVMYVEGLADQGLIDEVCSRLHKIDIDGIMDSAYVEELIGDNPFTPFPQLMSTERPDVVCANLLEGRVAIMTENSPFALIAPITMFSLMQSPEDYYQTYWGGTLIRWLRYFFFLIALTIPSAYVAILTYHQEMIPTTLLLSIAKSREEIPFPALVEALLMEVTFEALREAGVSLPKQVGAAVSIVGALVIGQAAISSGLVSSPMVMVVAFTGIASFTFPRYTLGIAVRLLRFPLMFLAGFLGLLGLMLGVILIVVHLCTLRSFGVPYLASVAPSDKRALKDVFARLPIWMRDERPHFTGDYNKYRQPPGLMPKPPQGDDGG